MKNFPIVLNQRTFWISRSCAVVGFVFAKDQDGDWCVLANKRGEGTPDYQGFWNCPCGYLDYNETANNAINREIWEETGLDIFPDMFVNYNTNTDPNTNLQNVTIRFYCKLDMPTTFYEENFTTNHSEANEVVDIKWIKIRDIYNYEWAFGHESLIKTVYLKYIKIPWYKKLIKKLYDKWYS